MELKETCFNYCYDRGKNDGIAFFSSNEKFWINRIYKLLKKYPEEIEIIKKPEDNDGCIYCKLPQRWLRIQGVKKLSEEERLRAMERMAKARASVEKDSD